MKETYRYHGHSIDLELVGISRLGIRWTYFIDGRYCIQGSAGSAPIESARASALALAHHSIDVLDAMKAGDASADASRPTDSRVLPAMMDDFSQAIRSGSIVRPHAVSRSALADRVDDSR